MWLPTRVYERIPQFLFLIGLLLMSAGTYIGFDYQLTFFYFGVGFGCCTWGLYLFAMRRRARRIQDRLRESTDNSIPGAGSAT